MCVTHILNRSLIIQSCLKFIYTFICNYEPPELQIVTRCIFISLQGIKLWNKACLVGILFLSFAKCLKFLQHKCFKNLTLNILNILT